MSGGGESRRGRADGEVFVRSLKGERGRWYRELMANPDAVLHVEGDAIPVRAVRAADPDSVERVTRGFQEKYAHSGALGMMIKDEIAPSTVRLDAR
jgi:hypothetical protein